MYYDSCIGGFMTFLVIIIQIIIAYKLLILSDRVGKIENKLEIEKE